MRFKYFAKSAPLILITACLSAEAIEQPGSGMAYNTKETNALTFQCREVSSTEIECDFKQTSIRKSLEKSKLKAEVASSMEQFKDAVKECDKHSDEVLDILEGRKEPPIKDSLSRLSDLQKGDMLNVAKAYSSFCKLKTEKSYENLAYIINERETRTCSVGSNTFTQSFRLVTDELNGSYAWVADGTPTGSCGIVQLSRFEPEVSGKVTFWRYISKKAITNPKGTIFLNQSCSTLDQEEYIYDWRSKEHSMQCDYIKFSPF